jgi:hypothetical protein
MNPTSRRSFAKSLGLVGLLAAGVEGYKQAKERIVYKQDELPTAELEKQLEGKRVLQLQATYGEELPPAKVYVQIACILWGMDQITNLEQRSEFR